MESGAEAVKQAHDNTVPEAVYSKVPAVTLGFWVIKILATTLGETGGDTVSMTLSWGYLAATGLFAAILATLIWAQIAAKRFHPFLYWATIVASTTAGTTLADFATRSLGIGYTGGSLLLLSLVLISLFAWHRTLGSVNVNRVVTPRAEVFYWITITFSQTLGTALGDWLADTGGMGYIGAAAIFAGAIAVCAALYHFTSTSRVGLFWAAFILTRPLGAAVGDFLDKPFAKGGLALSRPLASAVLAAAIVLLVLLIPQRAGRHPGESVQPAKGA
ncbi:MAG: hypothetical protein GC201_07070 [Alphaproteobacteria bacterium]|nr:hypothetical protein [Alphaproteobacteria bacterium]